MENIFGGKKKINDMKKFIYITLSLVLSVFSCVSEEDGFDYPKYEGVGDYVYTSHSTYTGPSFNNKEVVSQGYLKSTLYNTEYEFLILPNVGWSYTIYGENVVEEILSGGETVFVFRINASIQYVNSEQFRIVGTANVRLLDSDGTFIKYVDGYIKGDGIVYEYLSVKVNGSEQTITRTEGRQRL
jgi:hypothetical protein